MKCLNCAAPTKPIRGGSHYFCQHCRNYQLPPNLDLSLDGVFPSKESTKYSCPVCDDSSLVAGHLDDVEVGFCNDCRGILIVGGSLNQVLTNRRQESTYREEHPEPVDQLELQRQIDCPLCFLAMDVHPYYGPGNAVIDSCFRCGVLWLDHGEVKMLERAPGR